MKKIIGMFLLLLLLFTVACSKKEAAPIEEPQAEGQEEIKTEVQETAKEVLEKVEKVQEKKALHALLSGIETTEDQRQNAIIGVMLDNHPNARWQAGLREAEIVYEMRVEGYFTRYLALYQLNDPEAIGPVRSVRTPFVNRILEYDGILAHYGGSTQGMEDIYSFDVSHIDGMAVEAPVFYRNYNVAKEAPHNAYTSLKELRAYAKKRDFTENTSFKGFSFYEKPTAPGGEKVDKFTLYLMPGNRTAYTYLPEEGFYHRFKDGRLHVDENDKEPLEVTNILLQFADGYVVDAAGHVDVEDVGEGKGLLFTRGEMLEIIWKKEECRTPTEFFTPDGKPLKLNIGQTFIQVVDEDIDIEWE